MFTDKIFVIMPEKLGNADGLGSLSIVGDDTRAGSINIGYEKVRYKIIR